MFKRPKKISNGEIEVSVEDEGKGAVEFDYKCVVFRETCGGELLRLSKSDWRRFTRQVNDMLKEL